MTTLYNGKTWTQLTQLERAQARRERAIGKGKSIKTVETSNTLYDCIQSANYPANLEPWSMAQIERTLRKFEDWRKLQVLINMLQNDNRFTVIVERLTNRITERKSGTDYFGQTIPYRINRLPDITRYQILVGGKTIIVDCNFQSKEYTVYNDNLGGYPTFGIIR